MQTRLILSFLGLALAVGVILTSLFTASSSFSSTGNFASSEKTLYFGEEILPDHIFYPVTMVLDRVQLETTDQNQRVFLQVEYSHRRLGYALELLEKGDQDLAITTVTKAEQYLHHAVQEALALPVGDNVKQQLIKIVAYHQHKLTEMKSNVTDANRAVLDNWISQDQALISQLQ